MSVLLMAPSLPSPSQAWMIRSLDLLGDDMCSVAVWNADKVKTWRGKARVVSLIQPRSRLDRIRSRLGRRTHNTTDYILCNEINKPDVTCILCHYGAFAVHFMDIWKKTTVPLFVHFHGYDVTFDLRREDDPERRFHDGSYLEKILRLADRAILIANSYFTKGLMLDAGIPEERIEVKHLGTSVPRTSCVHEERQAVHIASVISMTDFKSPDRTIQAFEMACSKGLKGSLTVVGDGKMKVMCELMRLRSPYRDRINLPGYVSAERVSDLLMQSDIYTQHNVLGEISGQSECFGVSVIEAMAAGLPVVGTASGGVKETVVDQVTGFLGCPGDVDAQADGLLRLARDSRMRQRMGDAGRKRVLEHFTLEHEARRLREILGC